MGPEGLRDLGEGGVILGHRAGRRSCRPGRIRRDFDFFQDLHDPVAALEGVVDLEMKLRRVFEDHPLHEQLLEVLALVQQPRDDLLLLRLVADHADIDVAALQVRRDIRALDGHQRRGEDDLAQDDLAQLAPDDFIDPFETMFHGIGALVTDLKDLE